MVLTGSWIAIVSFVFHRLELSQLLPSIVVAAQDPLQNNFVPTLLRVAGRLGSAKDLELIGSLLFSLVAAAPTLAGPWLALQLMDLVEQGAEGRRWRSLQPHLPRIVFASLMLAVGGSIGDGARQFPSASGTIDLSWFDISIFWLARLTRSDAVVNALDGLPRPFILQALVLMLLFCLARTLRLLSLYLLRDRPADTMATR